jgi:hypothetical protein
MSIFSQRTGFTPPDPHGAVGPETLVAVTSVQVESLYKDDGSTAFGPTPLKEMFASLSPTFLFDPKVVYDVHRSRFVLLVLDSDAGGVIENARILVAVSTTSVPATTTWDDWYYYEIDASLGGLYWADYPGLAVDEEAIYITCSMFSATLPYTFKKSLLWIVSKDPWYEGENTDLYPFDYIVEAGLTATSYGTYMPAMVRSRSGVAPNVGTFLVKYSGLTNRAGNEFVTVIQIDNPLSNPTFRHALVGLGDVDPGPSLPLADAPQKDTPAMVEVNNRKALGAVWANNQLWMVTTGMDFSGETSAFWIKLNANGVAFPPTLADKGYITGEDIGDGSYTFFPSVDVNSKGVAAFGFSASSPSIYPSAYAAIRDDVKDPAGTVRPAMLVKAGEGPYNINFGGPENRWGDYTGMALDPSNENCFWAFNEYAGAADYTVTGGQFGSWKTAWARLCYVRPPQCKLLDQVCTSKSQCCVPGNKVCDGPRGSPKRCKVCLRRGAACARTKQCCTGLSCRNRKCKP